MDSSRRKFAKKSPRCHGLNAKPYTLVKATSTKRNWEVRARARGTRVKNEKEEGGSSLLVSEPVCTAN